MEFIELVEDSGCLIPRDQMHERLALALRRDARFDLEPPHAGNDHHYRLRALGYIGRISVGGCRIVVRPRVPVATVLRMLSFTYDLERLMPPPDDIGIETLEPLFERCVSVVAERVQDRVRRGLYRHGVERPEDLCFARNGDGDHGHLSRLFRQDPYQRCRYDELTADLDDNQIMLWTLYLASRARLRDDGLDRKARAGYGALAGTMDLNLTNANACIGRFYRRLHANYRPEHGLCRLILEHVGPEVVGAERPFAPFNLNPATLFASYVVAWLKANLPKPYRLRDRYSARLEANGQLSLGIDSVIENDKTGERLMALHPRYEPSDGPGDGDVAQAAAHAARIGAKAAVIICSRAPARNVRIQSGEVTLFTAEFDIDQDLTEAGPCFLQQLELAA